MSAELMGLTAFLLALLVVSWAAQRLLRDRSFWLRYGVAIVAPAGLMLVVISFSFWGPLSLSVPPRPPAPAAPSQPAAPGAISNPQFDPAAFIQEQVRKLVPGSILFNPPTRMRVGEPERITVRISRSDLEGAIKSDLQGRGVPRIERDSGRHLYAGSLVWRWVRGDHAQRRKSGGAGAGVRGMAVLGKAAIRGKANTGFTSRGPVRAAKPRRGDRVAGPEPRNCRRGQHLVERQAVGIRKLEVVSERHRQRRRLHSRIFWQAMDRAAEAERFSTTSPAKGIAVKCRDRG